MLDTAVDCQGQWHQVTFVCILLHGILQGAFSSWLLKGVGTHPVCKIFVMSA